MRFLLAALLALALVACASIPTDPNLQGLTASAERQQASAADAAAKRAEQRAAAVQDCAGSTDVATCMLGLVALEAVAGGQGGQAQAVRLPAYTPPPSGTEKLARFIGAVSPLVGNLANAAVSWHQSDNAADTSRAQFDFLGGVVRDTTSGMQAVATGATSAATEIANAGPRIDVAGDLINGDGNATNGAQIGDNETVTVGRDQTGGDHQDGSIVGDGNRVESPGPIDNSDPGDDCSGESCNPTDGG